MDIRKGDIVQLTASAIYGLKDEYPDVYEKMFEEQRTGGEVVEVDKNCIRIDMGEALPTPLAVEFDQPDALDLLIQVVDPKKSCHTEHETVTPDMRSPFPAAPPDQSSPFPLGLVQFPSSPAPYMQDPIPSRVRISQWAITQFLQLKQYAIAQDLARTDDEDAALPDPTSDLEALRQEGKDLRAVSIDLSPSEERLYTIALQKIGKWIEGEAADTVIAEDDDMITEEEDATKFKYEDITTHPVGSKQCDRPPVEDTESEPENIDDEGPSI